MKNTISQLASWLQKNLISFFVLAIIFSLSSAPNNSANRQEATQLQSTVCDLENQVNTLYATIQEMNKVINDPYSLAIRYKTKTAEYKSFLSKERMYPETPFKFQTYVKEKNFDISTQLLAALIAYGRFDSAPQEIMYVNSAKRSANPFSRHFTGNAIDINFNCADEFLEWVGGTEGRDWLYQYQLRFYIEDSYSSSKFLAPWRLQLGENIFVNPKATGPHVHLEYVGKN